MDQVIRLYLAVHTLPIRRETPSLCEVEDS